MAVDDRQAQSDGMHSRSAARLRSSTEGSTGVDEVTLDGMYEYPMCLSRHDNEEVRCY